MNTPAADPIPAFFRGTGTDHAGRRHPEILAWSDDRLEMQHDYIQWLFPLRRRGRYNPDAPVLMPSTIEAFQWDPELREAQIGRAHV